MNSGLKLFVRLCGLLLVITSLTVVVINYIDPHILSGVFILIPLFFLIASAVLSRVIYMMHVKREFYTKMPVLLGVRIIIVFVGLFFLIIGMFLDRSRVLPFAITFVGYYLVFSVVETKVLMHLNLKKD